ncbi:hypothetical protein EDD31_1735 [Bogoriella caseilytica]|uniref:Uncharacterized protein n=1 Tax=Bogoriella caseilytica TaxID=56055 RepID=A0A3N2BDM8_9MICO|nr:hypothetical protein EDD31_1735 [Bogoriella caseilytica]
MSTQARRLPHRRLALIIVLVAVLIGAPTTSYGLWSHSASLPPRDTSTSTVATPSNATCTTEAEPGEPLWRSARIRWQTAGYPVGTTFQLRLSPSNGSAPQTVSVGTVDNYLITRGLLSGLVGGLLELLLGGGRIGVNVIAVHPSGWTSQLSSPTLQVRGQETSVLPVILGGVRCA